MLLNRTDSTLNGRGGKGKLSRAAMHLGKSETVSRLAVTLSPMQVLHQADAGAG